MIVKDEESLEEAILLVKRGPIRYSDRYAYIIITDSKTLESAATSTLNRGDIAIVVLQGMEHTMENHAAELRRVREQRRKRELKETKEYIQEHPGRVEKIRKHAEKKGQLKKKEEG